MKKINLVLGIHNHQPVGNFDFVFEHAYKAAYKPFIEILARHPKIKLAQHYTGVLFQWILKNHPEFFSFESWSNFSWYPSLLLVTTSVILNSSGLKSSSKI